MTGMYDAGAAALSSSAISWVGDEFRVVLVDTGMYAVNLTTDAALDDIPAEARMAVSPAIDGKTDVDGAAGADPTTFPTVAWPADGEALVIYQHTGVEATSTLVVYLDTGVGFPLEPNGGPVEVQWPASIFPTNP